MKTRKGESRVWVRPGGRPGAAPEQRRHRLHAWDTGDLHQGRAHCEALDERCDVSASVSARSAPRLGGLSPRPFCDAGRAWVPTPRTRASRKRSLYSSPCTPRPSPQPQAQRSGPQTHTRTEGAGVTCKFRGVPQERPEAVLKTSHN